MIATQTDERIHAAQIKAHTDSAIAAALKHDWEQAVQANTAILRIAPDSIEALNRLAKALLELGRLAPAKDAVDRAVGLDSTNMIARRNADRLSRAVGVQNAQPSRKRAKRGAAGHGKAVRADRLPNGDTPNTYSGHLLMREAGKTAIMRLIEVVDSPALERLTGGEALALDSAGGRLIVSTGQGDYIGRVHPRMAQRVFSLMAEGNRYEAAFLRATPGEGVHIIIGESYQHPSRSGRPSFPPGSDGGLRGYVRGGHAIANHDMGGPPSLNPGEEEDNDVPELDALVRAHDAANDAPPPFTTAADDYE